MTILGKEREKWRDVKIGRKTNRDANRRCSAVENLQFLKPNLGIGFS